MLIGSAGRDGLGASGGTSCDARGWPAPPGSAAVAGSGGEGSGGAGSERTGSGRAGSGRRSVPSRCASRAARAPSGVASRWARARLASLAGEVAGVLDDRSRGSVGSVTEDARGSPVRSGFPTVSHERVEIRGDARGVAGSAAGEGAGEALLPGRQERRPVRRQGRG